MTSMIGNQGMKGPTGKVGNKVPSGYKTAQVQNFTPEMMELFQQMFGHVGPDSHLSKLASGDDSYFAEQEAPALQQFSELQGGLASRFSAGSGRGSLGNRNSSGFQNTSTAAASNFAQQLQANRQGLQRQAIQDLRGLSNDLLSQKPYDTALVPKQQSGSSGWGGLGGAALGGLGGFALGGPAGAFKGAQLGYGVGSSF